MLTVQLTAISLLWANLVSKEESGKSWFLLYSNSLYSTNLLMLLPGNAQEKSNGKKVQANEDINPSKDKTHCLAYTY
jgi:hypothetical protein